MSFFVIAPVAAFLGFGGIAGAVTDSARVLCFLFLVVFSISLVLGLAKRGK